MKKKKSRPNTHEQGPLRGVDQTRCYESVQNKNWETPTGVSGSSFVRIAYCQIIDTILWNHFIEKDRGRPGAGRRQMLIVG